jgi:hypothetical protein
LSFDTAVTGLPDVSELRPMRSALAKMVAVLRAAAAGAALASALLDAAHLPWWWLGTALALVVTWTCAYVRWRPGYAWRLDTWYAPWRYPERLTGST